MSDDKKNQGEGFTMEGKDEGQPNKVDFSTFVFSLATGAYINMGLAPDPMTQKVTKNLDLAQQNIDILAIIQEKTVGNLSKEEEQLLSSILTEVRLRFVEAQKK